MLSVSRILAAVSVLLLFGLTANKGYAAEPFEALVIGLEYPPFVSMKVPGYGKAVRALRHRLPENWQIRMRMLPSARASTILRNSDDWLFSFFPPREGDTHIRKLIVQGDDIRYSLFRRREPGDFRWASLSELAGSTVASTRTLSDSPLKKMFTEAGMTFIPVNDIGQGLMMLVAGRTDYLLTAEDTGFYYADMNAIDHKRLQFADTIIKHFPIIVYLNTRHPQAQEAAKILQ